jgi:hypothetical protein
MVDRPTTYFPPRAPPSAGLAEDQIMGVANPGLHPGLSKFRPSGPGIIEKRVKYLEAKLPISLSVFGGNNHQFLSRMYTRSRNPKNVPPRWLRTDGQRLYAFADIAFKI